MAGYYQGKRTRNLYDPNSSEPFRLSRSKIDLFCKCPRCFYLDLRLGVGQPPGYPFNLNSAVDTLLKKEFDVYRESQSSHPLMDTYGIDAIPYQHPDIEKWRTADFGRGGVRYTDQESGFDVGGAIDDVWINPQGELSVVDYKATSKSGEVNIDAEWQDAYKRQMEVYQWLLRGNDFKVSNTGYFVYANASRDRDAFDGKLEFDVKIIPYEGSDSWIKPALMQIKEILSGDEIPESHPDCEFCVYRKAVKEVE